MLNIKTQQHKSISLRTLVNNLQMGISPQNVHHHQVFDLEKEPDFDAQIADDFSDKLEVMECHRMMQEDISERINTYQQKKSNSSNTSAASEPSPVATEPSQKSAEANQN